MKKTILYKTLFFCWTILALTGCDLDLQRTMIMSLRWMIRM